MLLSQGLLAGNEPQPTGARRISLGNAYTGVTANYWSLYGNPAGIAGMQKMQVGVHFENRLFLEGLNYGAAGFVMPFFDQHYIGLEITGFGFKLYNESKIGLTYATTVLQRIHLGAKVNLHNNSIAGYGSALSYSIDLGISALITKGLTVGFSASNVSQASIKRELGEKIPSIFDFGLAWQVSPKVLIVADLEKHIEYPFSVRGGVEYSPLKFLSLRVGASTEPVTFTGGFGLNWKALEFDFAASYDMRLGFSPHLSLGYAFGKSLGTKKVKNEE